MGRLHTGPLMRIRDWFRRPQRTAAAVSGMSRRDFFARVAGRPPPGAGTPPPPPGERVLHRFHVAAFPYHDGPVLVPTLRPGLEFRLVPEPGHPTNPDAIRIVWRKDHLGYVPADVSAEVGRLLDEGQQLGCRAVRVEPAAELSKVLTVELVLSEAS